MSNVDEKLHHLKNALGERKLKQLGLIVCPTCNKIMAQSNKLTLPSELMDKGYLTPEEMSIINQSLISMDEVTSSTELANGDDSSTTPKETTDEASSSNLEVNDKDVPSVHVEASSEDGSSTDFEIATSGDGSLNFVSSAVDGSYDLNELDGVSITNEQDLLQKLFTILHQQQARATEELGIGYTYQYPSTPLPHSISCSECGRLYAIAHPSLELLPLPVYLSDTEYEMIKGVYVDILL